MSKPNPSEALCYSIAEAATLLGVSRRTMYTIARQEGFPAIRISANRLIIPRRCLESWLASKTHQQGAK